MASNGDEFTSVTNVKPEQTLKLVVAAFEFGFGQLTEQTDDHQPVTVVAIKNDIADNILTLLVKRL